jgi:GTP-binding protein YchF
MNIGIIGLPQTGKKTLFELLVGKAALDHHSDPRKPARGVAEIQDPRFDALVQMYSPKRHTRARLEVLLLPKIEERAVSEGDIFRDLAEVEAFCHVVRVFENESVYHVSGSVDPVRDIDLVNTEFILHDLLFIEKRIERIDRDLQKMKDERAAKEKEVLLKLRAPLEDETPLRVVTIPPEDEKILRSYPLLSRRAMVVVLNVSDSDVTDNQRVVEINEHYKESNIIAIQLAVRTEAEIAALESPDERAEFMRELGIEDTALHALTEKCIEALGLVSFFTVAANEVRQWFVRRGSSAVEAAARIHTDLARGFIRAEVIQCADLFELGGEENVKHAGKLAVRGRDYVVEDGDILFIRFSV